MADNSQDSSKVTSKPHTRQDHAKLINSLPKRTHERNYRSSHDVGGPDDCEFGEQCDWSKATVALAVKKCVDRLTQQDLAGAVWSLVTTLGESTKNLTMVPCRSDYRESMCYRNAYRVALDVQAMFGGTASVKIVHGVVRGLRKSDDLVGRLEDLLDEGHKKNDKSKPMGLMGHAWVEVTIPGYKKEGGLAARSFVSVNDPDGDTISTRMDKLETSAETWAPDPARDVTVVVDYDISLNRHGHSFPLIPRPDYRTVSGVDDEARAKFEKSYSIDEARKMMLRHGCYGPWHDVDGVEHRNDGEYVPGQGKPDESVDDKARAEAARQVFRAVAEMAKHIPGADKKVREIILKDMGLDPKLLDDTD